MNTKNNQRFRQTERLIIDTFVGLLKEKDVEKITVSEICRLCGINRASFYLHFTDVYGLMEHMERQMGEYFGEIFTAQSGLTFGERFMKLFSFLSDNRDFYRAYFNAQRPSRTISVILPSSVHVPWEKLLKELGIRSQREYEYNQAFFKAGLTALLKDWIKNDCPETPGELMEILDNMYSPERREHFRW